MSECASGLPRCGQPIDEIIVNEVLNDVNIPRLLTDIVEYCEFFLSFEEAKGAVYIAKIGKTPGSDGLPARFYKKFFIFLAKISLILFFVWGGGGGN